MNKTVKTVAWICLVLGVLGTALDAGAFVFARKVFVSRRTSFEEMREQYEAGELPHFEDCQDEAGEECEAMDFDRKPLDRFGGKAGGFSQRGFFGGGMIGMDRRAAGGQYTTGWGSHPISGGHFALPFLMIASGPVLLVIGAVMLIVNREPAKEDKKVKSKKSK